MRSSLTFVVRSDEAQDILVSQHYGLIDLGFAEPRALFARGEDLHRHFFTAPLAPPHLAKTSFADALLKDDGSGDGPLDEQRQTLKERGVSLC